MKMHSLLWVIPALSFQYIHLLETNRVLEDLVLQWSKRFARDPSHVRHAFQLYAKMKIEQAVETYAWSQLTKT